jgi:hypothetical protein
MGTSKASKTNRAARVQKVVAGLQKYFLNLPSILIGNVSYTPTDLIQLLATDVAADTLTTSDRAKLTADAEAARSTHQKIDPILRLLKMFVVAQFTDDPDAADKLGDFGYSPRKVPTRTAAAKAQAAQKADATRVARHTMSSKEKATIHGTIAPTPVSAPAPVGGPVTNPPTPVKPTA